MTVRTTYTQARRQLATLLDEVVNNWEIVIIERRGAEAVVLVAVDELSGLLETTQLLRSPANRDRLVTALARHLPAKCCGANRRRMSVIRLRDR
jgi:antitoxin YefM